MNGIFEFLRLHGKYLLWVFTPRKLFTWGLNLYNAMMRIFILFFSKCNANAKRNKYAKINAM